MLNSNSPNTLRPFLITACAVTFLTTAPRFSQAEERFPRPNVVIMFTDDQGTLDANCYGSTDLYTPAMDALAKTGVRFTQAYAHTVC